MKRSSGRQPLSDRKGSPLNLQTDPSDQEYRVGPGRPPKEYQWKPGQSGNPKGAPRRPKSIVPDLMASFEHALNAKVTLRQGEKETIVTKFAAGIEQLVTQFAKGDRHARRDFLQVADRLGILEGLRKAMNKKAREEIRRITPDMSDEEAMNAYMKLCKAVDRGDDDPET